MRILSFVSARHLSLACAGVVWAQGWPEHPSVNRSAGRAQTPWSPHYTPFVPGPVCRLLIQPATTRQSSQSWTPHHESGRCQTSNGLICLAWSAGDASRIRVLAKGLPLRLRLILRLVRPVCGFFVSCSPRRCWLAGILLLALHHLPCARIV